MKTKLNSILLLDDDEATNFYHERIIRKADCTHHVVSFQCGYDVLNYFKSPEFKRPDLFFLDVNMPVLNAWDFLREYETLECENKDEIRICLLTAFLSPSDAEKAKHMSYIKHILIKPLTLESIHRTIDDCSPGKAVDHSTSWYQVQ